MKKNDLTCSECGAGFRRLELTSKRGIPCLRHTDRGARSGSPRALSLDCTAFHQSDPQSITRLSPWPG